MIARYNDANIPEITLRAVLGENNLARLRITDPREDEVSGPQEILVDLEPAQANALGMALMAWAWRHGTH